MGTEVIVSQQICIELHYSVEKKSTETRENLLKFMFIPARNIDCLRE